MNHKKKGFTLVEVVLIIVIVSIGMMTVITALSSGNKYLQRSREKIIAINLAREWVEQMINIRDSNWKKNAGRKEETRLRKNPIQNIDSRFASGSYIIQTEISGGQQYFYGTWPFVDFDSNQGMSANNLKYSLCQTSTGWQACPGNQPTSVEGKFFRSIHGVWLYKKYTTTTGWDLLNCISSTNTSVGVSTECKDTSAKEYRFCVTVDYIENIVGKVELCSVITNFKK